MRCACATHHHNRKGLYAIFSYIDPLFEGNMTPMFAVTFVFPDAIITTTIKGPDAIIPRASAKLKDDLGVDTDKAQEVQVHEHP